MGIKWENEDRFIPFNTTQNFLRCFVRGHKEFHHLGLEQFLLVNIDPFDFVMNRGMHDTGTDQIDLYSQVGAFHPQRISESGDGPFAGAVWDLLRNGDQAGQRTDIDNLAAALFLHDAVCGDGSVNHPPEVHIDNVPPVPQFQVAGLSLNGSAGIIDHNVNAPIFIDYLLDNPLGILEQGDVHIGKLRLAPGLGNIGGNLLGSFLVNIDRDHDGAFPGQLLAESQAQPGSPSGNECNFILKITHGLQADPTPFHLHFLTTLKCITPLSNSTVVAAESQIVSAKRHKTILD